jgi:pilus assembly protein CpaD
MTIKTFARVTLVAGLGFGLAACATNQSPTELTLVTPTEADNYAPTVREAAERFEMPATGLETADVYTLGEFAGAWNTYGRGPIYLSQPADGAEATRQAHTALINAGVPADAIVVTPTGAGPVAVSFARLEAVAAPCPPVGYTRMEDSATVRRPNSLGCAVNANLAAMIADPADLAGPRAMTPADAARRAVVMDKYQAGQPTAAQNGESVAISNAVQ